MKINGKPVVDARRSVTLKISESDCRRGDKKNPGSCAAAKAATRLTDCSNARIHVGVVYLEKGDRWLRYKTSPALRTEIVAFDRGGQFEPGSYKIHAIPQETPAQRQVRLKKKRAANALRRNRGGGKNPQTKGPRKQLAIVKGVRSHAPYR